MTRDEAVGEAAVYGLVGTVFVSVGNLAAGALFATLSPWVAAVPALVVWGVLVFYGMKQFAHGVYTVVEDATR